MMIVVFENDDITCPMAWSDKCEGSIRLASQNEPYALFETREDARKAIRISSAFAKLQTEQGKPANTDFLRPHLQCIKIKRLEKSPQRKS